MMLTHRIYAIVIVIICCLQASPACSHKDVINVCDPPYSAAAGDQYDDTAAFQSALDAAKAQMKNVYVPPGSYWFTGHLTVPAGVALIGSWEGPPGQSGGSTLNATEGAGNENGTPFISLESNAQIKGFVIAYPNQSASAAPPTPYPWTIRGLATDCKVENLMFIRAYQAIDFGTYPCSRHFINNVYGSPLRKGIYIDGSIDVGRINNVHFKRFGVTSGSPLHTWMQQNGEVLIIGKADWEWITNVFAYYYKTGFRFINGTGGNNKASGPPNYVQIAHCGMDNTLIPMQIETCSGLNVTQSVFKGKAIQIQSTNPYPIRFNQCNFSPIPGTTSLVEANGLGRVSFVDCAFEYWDTSAALAPALKANCAAVSVQGCEFGTNNRQTFFPSGNQKVQIEITSNVQSAVIIENRLRYGQKIINKAGSRALIKDNVTDNLDGYNP